MLSLLAALATLSLEPANPACTYDRELELSRDVVSFDQAKGQGWRPLYNAKCYIEAAQLLRDWRARHGDTFDLSSPRQRQLHRTLVFHEAQMWAFGGRDDVALPIFENADVKNGASNDWKLYVDGTLAFLRRDKAALKSAINDMAKIPAPPGWGKAVGADGKPISLPWPINLPVLEGLLRCWDQPYAVAFVCRDIPR